MLGLPVHGDVWRFPARSLQPSGMPGVNGTCNSGVGF